MLSKISKNKRKTLVGIFAHPDDESFGPCCTLYKYSKTHNVFIICVTKGEEGMAPKNITSNLGQVRENELEKSSKMIGVKKVYFLGFIDGSLSNSIYHKLASEIENILNVLKPEIVITFEPRGVSGHIDHIVTSMVTTYVVQKLNFIKKLYYYCLSNEERKSFGDYFVYVPPGYKKTDITKTVDVSDVWEVKLQAMLAHKSQSKDARRIIKSISHIPKEEHFIEFHKIS